ncbi:MAG: preprotein translocase subunit SecE [Abitibacteriaceae bacterium]|nr:preprotein translocase subunit SecE [Abditibacteriaceae bacterium]
MRQLKTCPALVPPPPVPPVPRAPAAAGDPSPDPPRSRAWSKTSATRLSLPSFLYDVLLDLRRMVWPTRNQVCAQTFVTVGLLGFFTGYILTLDYMIHALLHFIGL